MRGKKKEKWEKEELLVSALKCRYGGIVEKGKEKKKEKIEDVDWDPMQATIPGI